MRRSIIPLLIIVIGFVLTPTLVRSLLRPGLPDAMMVVRESPRKLNDFAFADAKGKNLSLDQFGGKTILINVWATWCVPCREEMASLDRLASMPIGKVIQIAPVSIDLNGVPTVLAFYKRNELRNLPIYVDPSKDVMDALGIVGIPTTIFIDSEGREIGRMVGPAKWDSDESVQYLTKLAGP